MKTNLLQNNTPLSITRDSGANVKVLKNLEQQGYIKIFDVMLENGRENKKVKDKIKPLGVWNHGRWDEMVWVDENEDTYEIILSIIGKDKIGDGMHLESHIRNRNDYFVTEDNDFLNKRKELEKVFSIRIVTPQELEKICIK